jgi:hypothetical protein
MAPAHPIRREPQPGKSSSVNGGILAHVAISNYGQVSLHASISTARFSTQNIGSDDSYRQIVSIESHYLNF